MSTVTADRAPGQSGARPATGRRFIESPIYVAGWMCIATAASGYMAALAVRPDLVGGLAIVEPPAAIVEVASEELVTLRTSTAMLVNEVAALRANLASAETREQALKERLSLLEIRADAAAAPEPRAKPAVAAAPKAARPNARLETSSTEPAEPKAKPAPASAGDWRSTTRLLNPTPTIAVPALPPAQPRASLDRVPDEPRSGPVGVQIATGPSIDSLRLSWSMLSDRHGGTLRALEPRVSTANGSTYDLVAGPIASEADAQRICSELQSNGVACRPARFGGQGL